MPECISFRLAVLVYRCLHGSAPGYLASDLQRVSHLNARRRLRSSTTSALVVPRTVRSTIGEPTFPAIAASVWNSLQESVWSLPSLQVFRSRLKNRTFCPVLQSRLTTSHCTDYYYVTSLYRLIDTCPSSLKTKRHAKVYSSFVIIIIITWQPTWTFGSSQSAWANRSAYRQLIDSYGLWHWYWHYYYYSVCQLILILQ